MKQSDAEAATATGNSTNEAMANSEEAPANPYADETKQYAWLTSSEETVKGLLKDPDSAEFKDVRFYSGGGVPVACGEVNAQNGFGGYNGFEYFIALGPTTAFLESQVSGGISKVWNKYCVAGPDDKASMD
jgi:hypothetical protein